MARSTHFLLFLALLGTVTPACAMAKASASPPVGSPGPSASLAGAAPAPITAHEEFQADGANVTAESVSRTMSVSGLAQSIRARRADKRAPMGADASAPAQDPAPAAEAPDPGVVNTPVQNPTAASGEGKPEAALAQDPADHGRFIIYTAAMQIGVFDLQLAMQKAETLPEKFGGYVQTMTAGNLVLRIPSQNLKPAMRELGDFGNVEMRSLSSQDVSDEYLDLETQIRVLRETQAQLIELLQKAKTVEEALRVRESLDRLTMELEQAMGRLRQLKNSVAFSTLTLNLIERGPHQPVPTSNDPFPWVDALGVEATEWK